MKAFLKQILKNANVYHPLQSFYRSFIDWSRNAYFRLTYSKYKGEGFVCNFCNASYKKFVPEYPSPNEAAAINQNDVIAGYGSNVFCPNCMSKNRERLLLAVIQHMLNIENKSILHFSPEKHLHHYLKTKANVTTVDIMPGFYRTIDSSVSYADATNLQFEDEQFDFVIANHILEHIPDDVQAIKEINRVLKKGGITILQVPYSEKLLNTIESPFIQNPIMQERLYGQRDHVRIYALNDYIKRLENGGFTVKVLTADFLKQYRNYAIQEKECVMLNYK